MRTHKLCFFFSFLLLTAEMLNPQNAFADTYVVAIAPSIPEPISSAPNKINFQTKPSKIQPISQLKTPSKEEAWQAIFDYLGTKANIDFKFEPASSQLRFELNLAKGYYDFAYATPLQFIAFNDFPGYKAVVKRKAQPIKGMVFVKRSGPISTLSELRGATLVFPGTLDFPASIVLRESLDKLGVKIFPKFLASKQLVYSSVSEGSFIAGGGTYESFNALSAELRNTLRIIWDSPGYTPYAFSAHTRVPFYTIIKLQRAMIGLIKEEKGRALLPYIFVDNGFEVARDSDWDDAQLIDLNKLNHSSVESSELIPSSQTR